MAAATSLTPEQRRERSRKAGQAAHAPEVYVRAVIAKLHERTLSDADRAALADALEATSP